MAEDKLISSFELLKLARENSIPPVSFLKVLWSISKGFTREGRIYKPTQSKPTRIFRARIFPDGYFPTKTTECSYPPSEITSLGRANLANAPVFYASAGGPTTFVESNCKKNDMIVISEFRIYSPFVLQEIGIPNQRNPNLEYETLMHELFTHPGKEYYKYSASIAEHLMSGPEIHGLLYPSITSQNKSHNLAFKTTFVDQSIHFVNATAYRVTNTPDNHKYNVNEINFGVKNNLEILWKGRKKQWTIKKQGEQLEMHSTGWCWDAYDSNGCLIDPE